MQEHGGGNGGVLAGGKDMLLSKMLFGPFIELMNNRNYFGQEIWDTNAPGYQQVQQALRHIVSQQLSPMSVSERNAHRGRRPPDRAAISASARRQNMPRPRPCRTGSGICTKSTSRPVHGRSRRSGYPRKDPGPQ